MNTKRQEILSLMFFILYRWHESGPYFFMAVATITSSALCLLLSETKGLPTLECGDDVIDQEALLADERTDIADRYLKKAFNQ